MNKGVCVCVCMSDVSIKAKVVKRMARAAREGISLAVSISPPFLIICIIEVQVFSVSILGDSLLYNVHISWLILQDMKELFRFL